MVQFPAFFFVLLADWTRTDIVQRQGIIENPINAWGKNTIWCSTYRWYTITITTTWKHRTRSSAKANTCMGKLNTTQKKWNFDTHTQNKIIPQSLQIVRCEAAERARARTYNEHFTNFIKLCEFVWIFVDKKIYITIINKMNTKKLAHIKF